jgi:hypothetical protein
MAANAGLHRKRMRTFNPVPSFGSRRRQRPLSDADSTGRRNKLQIMQRLRIYYTESQKALMWERWRKGESQQQFAQLFDRNHS